MELPTRMKNYTKVADYRLMSKEPVILWVDGKAFHTFTRGLKRPFDDSLITCFRSTIEELFPRFQGCRLVYHQSNEVSFLLTDWENFETSAWFDYRVQKLASIGASMFTATFNKLWAGDNIAMFDCRAFNLPRHEVNNWFIHRQLDWIRNSVQMLARAHFSHNELQGLNRKQLKDKLLEIGVDWDSLPKSQKHGNTFTKDGWEEVVYLKNREFIEEML